MLFCPFLSFFICAFDANTMPTAVLDIDVEDFPREITGLSAYGEALVLMRLRERPIGHVRLPVRHGCLLGSLIQDALIQQFGWQVWERWLHDWVDWDEDKATSAAPPAATVAICTRDRPEDIRRCLGRLMAMPDDGQDFLLVDNCPSTEATRRIVKGFPKVRYVRENRIGLNRARNRAMYEAGRNVVAFIDDDAIPDSGWLRGLLRNFDDPLVACVTGLTMPLELDTDAQEMHERWSPFGRGYKRRIFDSVYFNSMAAGQVGAGVNMALRCSIFKELGPFDEALDAGTVTRTGGDTEMFARILNSGYRIVYEPRALSWHRHRRTWKELRKMVFGNGAGVYASWTSLIISQRQIGMLKPAMNWLFRHQLPALLRSVRWWHKNAPLDLAIAELAGCIAGPWLYFSSRRRQRTEMSQS
jgi:GT2 family glycosyltransferase